MKVVSFTYDHEVQGLHFVGITPSTIPPRIEPYQQELMMLAYNLSSCPERYMLPRGLCVGDWRLCAIATLFGGTAVGIYNQNTIKLSNTASNTAGVIYNMAVQQIPKYIHPSKWDDCFFFPLSSNRLSVLPYDVQLLRETPHEEKIGTLAEQYNNLVTYDRRVTGIIRMPSDIWKLE